jgi:VanZ family protein
MLIRYSLPAVLWSLVILILTLLPGRNIPNVGFFQIDKIVHFFIFGVLMILSSYGLTKVVDTKGNPANPLLLTGLFSVGFGIVIEILQLFVPGRSFSAADMLANSIGVGLGFLIFMLLKKWKLV